VNSGPFHHGIPLRPLLYFGLRLSMAMDSYIFCHLPKYVFSILYMPNKGGSFFRVHISLELHLQNFGFILTFSIHKISFNRGLKSDGSPGLEPKLFVDSVHNFLVGTFLVYEELPNPTLCRLPFLRRHCRDSGGALSRYWMYNFKWWLWLVVCRRHERSAVLLGPYNIHGR
jgi:hypothetical protein